MMRWTMEKDVQVQVTLEPSAQDQADFWSRTPLDKGDYKMDRWLFLALQKKLAKFIQPNIDLFASPWNRQLDKFVSRHPTGSQTGKMP